MESIRTNRDGITLLVVDDDVAVLRIACKVLERAGYAVLPASGGRDALERARTAGDSIDLVVTDVVMPGASGPELVEAIRRRNPALPVLYMSAFTEDDAIVEGVRDDDVHFLPKPFTPRELVDAVASTLERG
ncbi:MAG: response regulator [Gemmatimonadota bacterium]|jgi:two-component system cell cycle sensor histidine kinase/response regulator CckA